MAWFYCFGVAVKKFKYYSSIKDIKNCPPRINDKGLYDAPLFRFVSGRNPSEKDFIPPKIIDPARVFKGQVNRCSSYAVSFFTSFEKIKKKKNALINMMGEEGFRTKLGGYIAECHVKKDDGVLSVGGGGHADFHPYVSFKLPSRINGTIGVDE